MPKKLENGRLKFYESVKNLKKPNLNKEFWKKTILAKEKQKAKVSIAENWSIYPEVALRYNKGVGLDKSQINMFTLFKALLKYSNSVDKIDFNTFRAGLGVMALSNPEYVDYLFDICQDKRLHNEKLNWEEFLDMIRNYKPHEDEQ